MYKHTFYYFLGNKKYPEIYILHLQIYNCCTAESIISKVVLKCDNVKLLAGGSKKLQQVTSFAGTKEELLAVNRCFLPETDSLAAED